MKNRSLKLIFFVLCFYEKCRCSKDFENYESGVRDVVVLSFFDEKKTKIGTVSISLNDLNEDKSREITDIGNNRCRLIYKYDFDALLKNDLKSPLNITLTYKKRVRLISPTQGAIYEYKIDSIVLEDQSVVLYENKGWLSSFENNANIDAKIFL